MRLYLSIACLIVSAYCYAQDFQSSYNTAVKAFQAEEYQEALKAAEQAYKTALNDPKNQAYALQILTASCLQTNLFEKGLSYIDSELDNFKKIDPKGENYIEAIRKKGNLLSGAGRPLDAAKIFNESLPFIEQINGKTSYAYNNFLLLQADALFAAGQFKESVLVYKQCMPALKQIPEAGEDYLFALYHSAFAHFQLKDFEPSKKSLEFFIQLADQNNLTDIQEYADAKKILSQINSTTGETSGFMVAEDKAKIALQAALEKQAVNVQEALQKFQECEKIITDNKLLNATSFSCYLNFSRFLFSLDRLTECDQKLQLAQQQAEKLFQPTSVEVAHIKILKADLLLHEEKNIEAYALYKEAMSNLVPGKFETYYKQTRWIGEQLINHDLDQQAIRVFKPVLSNSQFNSIAVHDRIFMYKLNASAHINTRKFDSLIQKTDGWLKIETQPDIRQNHLLAKSQALHESGKWREALDVLTEATNITEAKLLASEVYYEQARLYQQLGDFKRAEIAYRKAVDNTATSLSPSILSAQITNSFATFYIELGNYEQASTLLKSLLERKDLGTSFKNTVRQNLAAMYEQTSSYDEATKLLLATVKSDKQILGESHPDYAIGLQNLAALYQKTGKSDSALLLYNQALEIDRKVFGEKTISYATKLANVGAVLQDLKKFTEAKAKYEQALLIRKELLGEEHPDYAANLYNIAYLLERTNQSNEALPYFQKAAKIYLHQIKNVFPVLSDYERTAFYDKVQPVIRNYEMFLLKQSQTSPSLSVDLMNFRLETKALLLSASVKTRNQILKSNNEALIQEFALWQNTKEKLATLYSLSSAEREAQREVIKEFTDKANDLEKSLTLKTEGFASSYTPAEADWKKIQQALKADEAAIEIVRAGFTHDDSVLYGALIIKPGLSKPDLVILDYGEKLENRFFKRYINSIRYLHPDDVSYDIFWKKIDEKLQDVKVIYLSPDGVFNKINCLTLHDQKTNEYLIERYQINLISNLKDLNQNEINTNFNSLAVLLGSPDYGLKNYNTSFTKNATRSSSQFYQLVEEGIAELPGTEKEVQEINKTLSSKQWSTTLLLSEKALEENIKQVKDPGLLHIATHGFFIVNDEESNSGENNPMLRSGLLLAGSGKNLADKFSGKERTSTDDGILTAYEVMNLNLDKTNLVVLSACETAVGDIRNGEGVYGLQRAFMLAGANNLMMSLWKVDDAATQQIMTTFYSLWAQGNNKGKSFYESQLQIKQKLKDPYYWGAFVMVGRP